MSRNLQVDQRSIAAPHARIGGSIELIRLEDISKVYRAGEIDVPVLKGVSLSIRRGELVALMGASGSGKTTLMNLLGCLDRPTAGKYWLNGEDVSGLSAEQQAHLRGQSIGFVFQSFNLLPRTSALENVMLPLECGRERLSEKEMAQRARDLLERIGLGDRLDYEPSQLSGGQQQRVAIARALVNRPQLLLADEPTGNLDSQTSAEILKLFQQLNAEGLTILVVTHDPEVAAHARRVIRIRDGAIERGEAPPEPLGPETFETFAAIAQPDEAGKEPRAIAGRKRPRIYRQFVPRAVHTALHALRHNAVRSALTTLGIIIGIGAVITMMEVGQGSKKAIEASIASMGANSILILPGAAASGGIVFGIGSVQTLTPDDAQEILRQCPGVESIAPIVRARTQVIYKDRNWIPLFIYGTTPDYLKVRDWELLQDGVPFTERDVRNGLQVCLMGQTLVRELFQGRSPLGEEIRIQNVPFKVVGVLRRKGANLMGLDQDDIVVAPWTTIKFRVSGTTMASVAQTSSSPLETAQRVNTLNQRYPSAPSLYPTASMAEMVDTPQPVRFITVDQILAKTSTAAQIPQSIEQMTQLLRERHHIHPGKEDDFSVRDMTEIVRALATTSQVVGSLLLAVAMISLVVGGVGIMNIMLVSVTERTREIGLRMAVGAAPRMILRQFLIEAIVLCLLGGALGVILGRSCSFLVWLILSWPTEISPPAVFAAVAVAISVGLVFGYYPAWKASRLDPIDALRYE